MADSPRTRMSAGRFKTLIVIGILGINLLIIGLSWLSLLKSRQQYSDRATVTAQNLTQVLEQNITGTINKIDIAIIALAQEVERQLAAGGVDENKLNDYMIMTQSHLPELNGLRVVNAKGVLFYGIKTSSGPPIDVSDRDYFMRLRDNPQDQLMISKPVKGRIDGKWVIALARRISKPDGTFAGVAFGSLALETINTLFASLNIGKQGLIALRDGTDLGIVARYPEPEGVGSAVGYKQMSKDFAELQKRGKTAATYDTQSSLDHLTRTWAYRKFANNAYYIFVGLARDEYLADWNKEVFRTGIFLALFFLISIISGMALYLGWKRNKAADESLRANDEQLRLFFERQIVGMAISSPDKHWTQLNDKWCQILGYERDELFKMTWEELTYPEDLPENIELFNQLSAGSINDYTITKRFIRKNGSIVVTELSVGCVRNEDGTLNCLLSLMEDVSELKRMEEQRNSAEHALKKSEERFRSFIEQANDIVFSLSTEGIFTYVSPNWKDAFGYELSDTIGKPFVPFVHPDDVAACFAFLQKVIETAEKQSGVEYRVRHKNGTWIWYSANGSLLHDPENNQVLFLGIGRDITERMQAEEEHRKLENQLLHAQKLESLGVLAGGIAHDFNNILTSIVGNAELAVMRIPPESPAVANLHRIEQSATRAADLARQMLAYSGRGQFVIENLSLNSMLEELFCMLEISISKKIELRLNLDTDLPAVEGDSSQIQQVLMNLVINASEAIGDASGVISISTSCRECDRSFLKNLCLDETVAEGKYVCLEISDTGCGMDKETLDRIFDPFFTTKFTGRGLGMAAVHGIIRSHKGAITVVSELKKGTTFQVLLPASADPAELFSNDAPKDDWKGTGIVLLVDDEETVRGIGVEMLKELGFETITANDGAEAIELFTRTPGISFVILDLTMPHMDGGQCFHELRQLKPDVKVILSSGYNEKEVTQLFDGKELSGFVQKPYKFSLLKNTIKRMFDA